MAIHAAGEASPGNLNPGTYAVALGVETEQELKRLADRLEAAGGPVHRVVESHGRYAGQTMALGIAPGPKSIRGRLLSNLPLLRADRFRQWYWSDRELQQRIIAELEQEIHKLKRQQPTPWWRRLWLRCSKGATA